MEQSQSKVRIAYMRNADPVFFTELDDKIMKGFTDLGAEVLDFKLDEIYVQLTKESGFKFYINGKFEEVDALLSYGYMSGNNIENYKLLMNAFTSAGKITLHSERTTDILDNKLLQNYKFQMGGVPIPDTYTAFKLPGVKSALKNHFDDKVVIKTLSDYAGDGVRMEQRPDLACDYIGRTLWKDTKVLFQKMVPDSWGRSVRVLVINGKAFALAEYQDRSNDFKSNNNYYENVKLVSLMDSPKRQLYSEIGEKAALSVDPCLTIGGVDILDSEKLGPVVLEINPWPDVYDIAESTKLPVFETFYKAFYNKVVDNKQNNKQKNK